MSGTMRAVVLHGKEDARLEVLPIPQPGPGEVRIRIRAALTCGTDLKVFRRGYHARMIVPPAVFGHELAGEIDAIGDGVTEWRMGEHVVAANSAPCGKCFYCGIDREELCEDLLFLNGAYAEYIVVPARIVRRNLLRVPEGLSFEAAALVEPLACAILGVEQTGVRSGESVVVLGAGPLGLLLTAVAARRGAVVGLVGRGRTRLTAGEVLGAADTLDVHENPEVRDWVVSQSDGRGADRVIEAVGRPEVWEQALTLVRKGGTVNLFGGCPAGTSIALDTSRLHYDALTVLGTFHHTPATIRQALAMIAEMPQLAETIVQDRTTLQELPALLPRLAQGGGPLKVAVQT